MRTTASPQQIWEAWTDPRKLSQWFTDSAEGEPRAGATFTWRFDRFSYVMPYEVLVAEPNRRWALLGRLGDRSGIVEITIEPLQGQPPPDGGVASQNVGEQPVIPFAQKQEGGHSLLRLVNSGWMEGAEWDDEFEGVDSGWALTLGVLKHYLENHFGQARSQFFSMRPAAYTYAGLLPYYLTAEGLSRWLTSAAEIGGAGSAYRFTLRDGGTAGGRVLTITRREALLSWEEIGGVLMLKAFGMGPAGRMLCIHGIGWGLEAARAAAIERQMSQALDRLAGELTAA